MNPGRKIFIVFIIFTFFLTFGFVVFGVYKMGISNMKLIAGLNGVKGSVESEVLGADGSAEGRAGDETEKYLAEEIKFNDPYKDLSVEQILVKLFSLKYEKPKEDIIVGISKSDEKYAMGGVSFKGGISGGWFLAANLDGEWEIVQDGNGTIICQVIEPYDFPGDMVPTCYDQEKMVVIARTGPDAQKNTEVDKTGEVTDETVEQDTSTNQEPETAPELDEGQDLVQE